MPDLQVIQFDPSTGIGRVEMPDAPKILTGLDELVQMVALSFLKNPGQDVIDSTEGSGIRAMIGQYNYTQEEEIKLALTQRAQAVERDILAKQSGATGDSKSKLKKLVVLDMAVDTENSKAIMRVRVMNEAGESTDVLL